MNAPLLCYRWFLDVVSSGYNMDEDVSPSIRRKIDSMARDLESIVRLLQQASFEQVKSEVEMLYQRMEEMDEQLIWPLPRSSGVE